MSMHSAFASALNAPTARRAPISLRGLPQTGLWRDAMAVLGHRVAPLAPVGLPGQATLREIGGLGTVATVARAPGFLDADQARALRRALKARHLIVQPDRVEEAFHLMRAGFRPLAPATRLVDVDLTAKPADMMAQMSNRWRSRLSTALQKTYRVERTPMQPDPDHWLLASLGTPAHQPGRTPLSPRTIAAICAVRQGAGQLITVRQAGGLMALVLFLRHGAAATCQIAWVSEAGRAGAAGHLAIWRAMLELRELGVQRLTFGHTEPRVGSNRPDFWGGAGGRTRMIGGQWLDTAWLPRRAVRPGRIREFSLAGGASLTLR